MKKYAVVIGINEYKDQSIGKLSCAANDAKVIGECLQDVCKFDDVRLFISGGDNEPTNDAILQTLSNLAPHLQEDDLFLFYFAGHGIHTEEGSYLLTCNSLAQFPSSGSLSMKDLERCFSNFDSTNRVLILDACRNNPRSGRGNEDNVLTKNFSRDILAAAKASTSGLIPATCILHSCSLGQRAYEWHAQGHGAFTYYLLEGMRGKAYDERGRLTVQSLGCYVQEQVPRWSKKCEQEKQIPWSEQAGSIRTICLAVGDAVAVQPGDKPAKEEQKPDIKWGNIIKIFTIIVLFSSLIITGMVYYNGFSPKEETIEPVHANQGPLVEDTLRNGVNISILINELERANAIVERAQRLAEISSRYQENLELVEKPIPGLEARLQRQLEEYQARIARLNDSGAGEIHGLLKELNQDTLSRRENAVSEIISKHLEDYNQVSRANNPQAWLESYQSVFKDFVD